MKFIFFVVFLAFMTNSEAAVIHKRNQYFIDVELSKKQFLIDCSGGPKDDNSIIGFHLLDGDTYYLLYYRRAVTVKHCHKLRQEYMDVVKNSETVRIVGHHPDEELMLDSDRKKSPAPFNKSKKIISATFIRLQANGKCKAYFSDDCDLPKRYWSVVEPGK